MTSLGDLIGDPAAIARMDNDTFDQYWQALGTLIRLAAQHAPQPATPPKRDPGSSTAAITERAGPHRAHRRRTTVQPFGFRGQP